MLGTVLLGAVLSGCTLITDVDRQRIPVVNAGPFPQQDGGARDAATGPDPVVDSGGAGGSGGEPDAAPDAEVTADSGDGDAGGELDPDASGDGG